MLPGLRYEQIKETVATMFEECGIGTVPVDPIAIAAGLGITVCSYASLGEAGEAAAMQFSADGFTYEVVSDDGVSEILVMYNDKQPEGRARFTLLHELGHVLLGHRQTSDVAEAEANFFAKFAIAPPSLVHTLQPESYLDLIGPFGLSFGCAWNSWNYYRKWLHIAGRTEYEMRLGRLFVVSGEKGGEDMLRIKRGA